MRTRALCLFLLAATCGIASATSVSYTGNLNNPNDVFETTFTLPTNAVLLIQTYGYGGGTNADGTVIAPGGFDPYLTLFKGGDNEATFVTSNDDGPCTAGNVDPNCKDSQIHVGGLTAGLYTLALTLPGNSSEAEFTNGLTNLSEGFLDGGNFFDPVSNSVRDPGYAVDIVFTGSETGGGGNLAATPEPASVSLLLTGLLAPAFLLLWKRRESFNPTA